MVYILHVACPPQKVQRVKLKKNYGSGVVHFKNCKQKKK